MKPLSHSLLLALGWLSGFQATATAVDVPKAHDFARFKSVIEDELNGKLAGGYAFAVLYKGEIKASGADGWARRPGEKTAPAVRWTPRTSINFASVSKTITAVGFLRLWDESLRQYSLDDPFWPHVKDLVPNASGPARTITIRQVLQHRSGLPVDGVAVTPATLDALLRKPLDFAPGTRSKYDNRNYYIIRLLIEAGSHENYAQYVRGHVLAPMGIRDMQVKQIDRFPALGYGTQQDKELGIELAEDATNRGGGAGGWYGSVMDLAKFAAGIYHHAGLSDEAFKEFMQGNLGWDFSNPCHSKGGDWSGSANGKKGEFHAALNCFPDDVQAVLVSNSHLPKAAAYILNDAWYERIP